MTDGKMMVGVVRRNPPLPLKLEKEPILRKEEEEVMEPVGSVERRVTLLGNVPRAVVETTSAGTAVRLV